MERISKPFNGKNYWRNKGYNLLDGATTANRKIQVIKINGREESPKKRRFFWKVKKAPKIFSLKKLAILSPKKLWYKFKNGYINMMLRMAGDVGQITGGSDFEKKRISKARQVHVKYKNQEEFEARLVLEIYKALKTSRGFSEVV